MADHKKTKKKKKKRGRSRIFTSCFRSFPADERPCIDYKPDDRIIADGRLGKPVLVAVSGGKGEEFGPDAPDVDLVAGGVTGVDRSSGRRGISWLIKAVLFESVMVKKNRSSSRSSIASDTSESFSSIEKIAKPLDDSIESTDIEDSISHRSNLLSSSSQTTTTSYTCSSSSSTNSNSQWPSDQKTSPPVNLLDPKPPIPSNFSTSNKPNPIKSISRSHSDRKSPSRTDPQTNSFTSLSIPVPKSKSKLKRTNSILQSTSHHKLDSSNLLSSACNNYHIRLCLFLLLSFIVLVVYGRIYSILCTSTWFYLVPCRRVKRVNSVSHTAGLDTESDEYKKRVIMAGLLDRTRNPLR